MLSALRSSGSSRICRHRRLSATAAVALAAVVQGGDDPRPLRAATLWSWSLQVPRSESPFRTMHQTRFDSALRFMAPPAPRQPADTLQALRLYLNILTYDDMT